MIIWIPSAHWTCWVTEPSRCVINKNTSTLLFSSELWTNSGHKAVLCNAVAKGWFWPLSRFQHLIWFIWWASCSSSPVISGFVPSVSPEDVPVWVCVCGDGGLQRHRQRNRSPAVWGRSHCVHHRTPGDEPEANSSTGPNYELLHLTVINL